MVWPVGDVLVRCCLPSRSNQPIKLRRVLPPDTDKTASTLTRCVRLQIKSQELVNVAFNSQASVSSPSVIL